MVPPKYEIGSGIHLVTPNQLPSISRPYANYTVVGAGKTGIDALLWLLGAGIPHDQITWIISRDAFFVNRAATQAGSIFLGRTKAIQGASMQSIAAATSVNDLLERLLACGRLLRLDDKIWPTAYRCATVSVAELEQLRMIKAVVRKGRVRRIDVDRVTLTNGEYRPKADTLYIDCSTDATPVRDMVPVFQGRTITLQPVLQCQQVFSAAFIGHVDATYGDDSEELKNDLCRPVVLPRDPADLAVMQMDTLRNMAKWYQHPETLAWLRGSRLYLARLMLPAELDDPEMRPAVLTKLTEDSLAAAAKLEQILAKDMSTARI